MNNLVYLDNLITETARSLRSLVSVCSAGLLVAGLVFSGQVHASLQLNSATLSVTTPVQGPAAAVYVKGGGSITAAVNGSTVGNTNWNATSWQIGTGTVTCDSSVSFTTNNSTGTLSYSITAPAAAGTYNTSFIAYSNTGCSANASNTLVLNASVIVDNTAPTVSSISLASANPSSAANVSWTVTFSETVTGVAAGNFALVQGGGLSGSAITSITGSGTTWTVTASTGTGSGSLGVNLTSAAGITDRAGNTLSGVPVTGAAYTVNGSTAVTVTGSPTLCVNDTSIGTQPWTGLTNVVSQNNAYAQATGINGQITNYLKCTGYGFSIPAGATITGITVGVWDYSAKTMSDQSMVLVKANNNQTGALGTMDLATQTRLPGTNSQVIYGGATNLWGNTWTAADINSSTFGAAFAAIRGPYNSTDTAFVDYMPITVDYTVPSTPGVTSINMASSNPSSPATAVSWTVTFSTSVTGVAAGNFALVQSGGVTGATITSVSGSGSTWTVTANTGSGYGTLGLNMTNVTGISPAMTTAMPFVGQVYTIPAPLTCITDNFSSGTLNTSLWTVKTISGSFTPQVVNVGGGDYRLRLTDTNGNEATFAQLKPTFPGAGNKVVLTFDYFSYGGSGADGIAVTFSDASVSSTTGGFGGSLGYAQNTNGTPPDGFGGGWMGTGIDDYGNFPNTNEGRQNYPAGWTPPAGANTTAGFYPRNVSIRGSGSGTTGYYLIANTGTLASGVAPSSGAAGATPYRYRVTLDHSDSVHAYVTVEVDTTGTGTSYNTLIPKFDIKGSNSGQAAVPTNWLVSFTGSTGGSTNYHEFKQVQVCANTIIGSGPDHLEIDHPSGTGLTCTPSTLTIKACANAACTTAFTSGLTGTLSATGTTTVNWSGGSGFSIPAGSSTVTKDVQVTTPGTTVFSATSSPAAATATTCNFGAPSCTFTSSDSGFLVSAPNHVCGKFFHAHGPGGEKGRQQPVVRAGLCEYQQECQPEVRLQQSCYRHPAGQGRGTTALNASGSAAAACDGTGANVTLTFDATGTATPTLQYADVGQMNVSAAYTGIPGSLDAGLSMTGTGSFIVAPYSFSFSGLPAGPIKAGNAFSATVTALNALGNATPNFGREIDRDRQA